MKGKSGTRVKDHSPFQTYTALIFTKQFRSFMPLYNSECRPIAGLHAYMRKHFSTTYSVQKIQFCMCLSHSYLSRTQLTPKVKHCHSSCTKNILGRISSCPLISTLAIYLNYDLSIARACLLLSISAACQLLTYIPDHPQFSALLSQPSLAAVPGHAWTYGHPLWTGSDS